MENALRQREPSPPPVQVQKPLPVQKPREQTPVGDDLFGDDDDFKFEAAEDEG